MSTDFRSDVYSYELDLSQVVDIASATYAICVGQTGEGTIEPTFVTNMDDWVSLYGKPSLKYGRAGYAMYAWFEQSGGAWFKRVVASDAAYGGTILQSLAPGNDYSFMFSNYNAIDPNTIDFDVANGVDNEGVSQTGGTPVSGADSPLVGAPQENIAMFLPLGPGDYSKSIAVEIVSINAKIPVIDSLVEADPTNGLVSTLTAGDYEYRVSAFNSTGETAASIAESVTVSANGKLLRLTWDEQIGITGYRVYRKALTATEFTLIARLAPGAFEYEDTGKPDISTASPLDLGTTVDSPEFTVNVYDIRVSLGIPQESFTCSLEERVNDNNQQTELTEAINDNSNYIRVVSNVANLSAGVPVIYSVQATLLDTGDAGTGVTEGDMILALAPFEDREAYTGSIVMDGGYTTIGFQKAALKLAEDRRWTLCTLSVPENAQGATESIDYRALELNINSSRAALFTNDTYLLDPYTNKEIAIPASADAAGRMAFTDRVSHQGYSPAGYRRGLVTNRTRVRERYSNSEKDRMAAAQVNYFDSERSYGIVLKEAYTMQANLSARSHIAVRRILDVGELATHEALKIFLQEPNDEITEAQIIAILQDFYDLMVAQRRIKRASVVSKTTDADVGLGNRNIFTLIEPLIPTIRIRHTTVITQQGASFSDVIEQV